MSTATKNKPSSEIKGNGKDSAKDDSFICVYVPALRRKGFHVCLAPGKNKSMFIVEPREQLTPDLHSKIGKNANAILKELNFELEIQKNNKSDIAFADPNKPFYRIIGDPRPDLTEDSEIWFSLLNLAVVTKSEAEGPLHGFRCVGTRLMRIASGWMLYYQSGVTEFEDKAAFEEEYKQYFLPEDDAVSRDITPINQLLSRLYIVKGRLGKIGNYNANL